MEEELDLHHNGSDNDSFHSIPGMPQQGGYQSPQTPNTAVSTLHVLTMTSLPQSEDRMSSGSMSALLATPKRKSLELDQYEKYPEVLVEHARLLDPSTGSSKRMSLRSHDRTSSNNDAIEYKSEAEYDDQQQHKSVGSSTENMNMLFGCIAEVIECKSEKERHYHDSVTFYSHQSAAAPHPEEFEANSTEKYSKEEQEMRYIEEEVNLRNNLPEIICRCALFWRRENCSTEDYRKFARLAGDYVELRMKPKPLNEVGEGLLFNGFFVLAFIKYISMPESMEEAEACEEAMSIQDNLFELFHRYYPLYTNKYEFEQAYQDNCRRQAELRMRKISISPRSPANNQQSNSLKRNPNAPNSPFYVRNLPVSGSKSYELQNKMLNERKSGVTSISKASSVASEERGVQTENNN